MHQPYDLTEGVMSVVSNGQWHLNRVDQRPYLEVFSRQATCAKPALGYLSLGFMGSSDQAECEHQLGAEGACLPSCLKVCSLK